VRTLVLSLALVFTSLGPGFGAPPEPPRAAEAGTFDVRQLRFNAYDGDPRLNPKEMSFQLKGPGLSGPPRFLKIGAAVGGDYKISKFAYKVRQDKSGDLDISELTLTNSNTKESVTLVFNQR
jgi:hypothetical protein